MDDVRTDAFTKEHNGIYLDFTRQRVTDRTLQVLWNPLPKNCIRM